MVTNINVKFQGGNVPIPNLNESASVRRPLNVRSESSLSISYYDSKGSLHETNLDTYLEPNSHGNIRLKIDANQTVRMKDETH